MHMVPPIVQVVPLSLGVTAQVAVPLQTFELHSSSAQVIGIPTHVPAVHVSAKVQAFMSSQVPVKKVVAQVGLPSQTRLLQASLVHVMAVPTHVPELLHLSV